MPDNARIVVTTILRMLAILKVFSIYILRVVALVSRVFSSVGAPQFAAVQIFVTFVCDVCRNVALSREVLLSTARDKWLVRVCDLGC